MSPRIAHRHRAGALVRERDLPPSLRAVLEEARAVRPGRVVTCISFHTLEDGRQVVHMGPEPVTNDAGGVMRTLPGLRAKDVLVLSVAVTETTFEDVRTVTHVLVARVRIRRPSVPADLYLGGRSRQAGPVVNDTSARASDPAGGIQCTE